MQANDGISSVLKTIGDNFGPLGSVIAGASAAAVGFGVASVQAAGQFQASMTSLVTGAGEAQSNIKLVSAGVLKMAADTGTSTDQLSKGMYMIESSGQHGAAGLQVLQAAAEGAKVGTADLGVTANALTTIMTDYHQPASAAVADMNALTTTVASGKTHLQDLASSMSAVLPLASSLGIQFPQIGGALATMTNSGMSAQQASQNLANALRNLAAPGSKAMGMLEHVGISAQQLKDTLTTQGLTGAMQLIEDHVGKSFPAGSVQAVEAMKAIMGGATGLNVSLMLGGKNMAAFEGNVKSVASAMDAGGNSVQGWDQVQGTFNFQIQRAEAGFQSLMITLGTAFLPVLTQVASFVSDAIAGFVSWEQSTGILQTAMSAIGNVIQGVLSLIHGGFSGLPDLATGWGQNMVQGFANGVINALDAVISAIVTVVDEISNYLGFASPSKKGPGVNLLEWGGGLVSGFAQGMTDNMGVVTDAASMVAAQLAPLGSTTTDVMTSMSGGSGTINMSGMTIAQAKQVEALIRQNDALKAAAAKQQGIVSGANGASTSAAAKHTASQAAAAAKHAASLAAAAAKHEASVLKHNQALAAAAARKEAATAKHQAVLEAAAKKHAEVLAAQAARHEAALAKKAAASAKKAGGGMGPAVAGALPTMPQLTNLASPPIVAQAQQAGQTVATAYASGFKTVKSAIQPELDGIASFVSDTISSITPMIKPALQIMGQMFTGVWNTLKTLGSAITSMLLPAFGRLVAAIAPIITNILKWVASSGIIKFAFAALGVAINIVVGIISGVVNAIAAVVKWLTTTQVGISILQAVGILLGIVAAAILVIAAVVLATLIPTFVMWVIGAIAVGVANVAAFAPIILIVTAIIAIITIVILIVKNWGAIAHWFQQIWAVVLNWLIGAWNNIVGFFQGIVTNIQAAFGGIGGFFSGIWNGIMSGFKGIINGIIGGINGFIRFMNGIHISLPAVWAGPVQILPAVNISMPQLGTIPLLAQGGVVARAGSVIVGDNGAELLDLPVGARVTPLKSGSAGSSGGGSGGGVTHNYYITVPPVSSSNIAAARAQGQAIGRALADRLRGSAITPTLVSGGLQQ
jgi:TP901 family phage tail tape measure protein